ncbi:fibronectin type III domain-containing protein, partial [Eubacterium sp.]|uniref:fibronectin type III domain-containing protein n=1 Tax=Eubacterium sp. TaxID=142586 RepID=UPI003EFD7889
PYFDATQIYHNFNGNICTVCGTKRETASNAEAPQPVAPAQPAKPVSVKPAKTSIKKISSGKKSITVQWKKISGISAYQVQIATNKKFTKNKKTFKVSKKSTKVKIKNLKAKKKYYVRVRSYKTVNGKRIYSKWSAIKTVKTK